MKNIRIMVICLVLVLLCTTVWGGAKQDSDLVMVNGEHWLSASEDEKSAYLFGVGNMLDVEQAMHGKNPSNDIRKNSIVPILIEGLSDSSIPELKGKLDHWYENKPDQLSRSVIEVLYIEFALPNVKSQMN